MLWSFARSALRAYRASFIGSFLIVFAAAALLGTTGVLIETGLRRDAPLLATVAASFAGTAVLVVVLIVGSTFASGLRQRLTQFALLRAIGATTAQVRSMVTAEVVLVFAIATPLGVVPGLFAGNLLLPALRDGGILPDGVTLTLSPLPVVGALLLLFPTAVLAARVAAREATRVSPIAAIGGVSVQSSHLSRGRRITAWSLLVGGVLAAGTPFVVPGTIGSATGATSAFLLIAAAALGGPAIVSAAARHAAVATVSSRRAGVILALINARGFSRRLTTAIIPLALLLALGTVQTGVNGSAAMAAGSQLREGLRSDSVITSPHGITRDQADAVGLGRTTSVLGSSTLAAEAKVDSDDDIGQLSWDQVSVRTLSGSNFTLIDPDVTAGSLEKLRHGATVAASSESLFASNKGVGDTIEMRFGKISPVRLKIVAVYQRDLGFGDFLMDQSKVPAAIQPKGFDVLFARGGTTTAGDALRTESVETYAKEIVSGAQSQQQLGAILLFVLLSFVAIAAGNTLVMLTSGRRAEFSLLRRLGATRSQVVSMIGIEGLFVVVLSIAVGTLAVLPALVGVAYGMVGQLWPAIDGPVYASLAAAVVVIASASSLLPAVIATRKGFFL